jgi:hypothetical protein
MDERFFLLDWTESSSQELSKIQQQMIVFDVCNHKAKKFPIQILYRGRKKNYTAIKRKTGNT